MNQLVECVPNFSEGKDKETIDAIGHAVRSVLGVTLLSIEPDQDYNRTVVTFIGKPEAVLEAAFESTKVAAERINMEFHRGEHPRIGAADVVPFVPIFGCTMDDCVLLAHQYGKRVSSELKIPVYLYESAATVPARKNLADIRKGEYEGLPEKIQHPDWKPDYGDAVMNKRSGATVAGARKFLIAYNVNLDTPNQAIAHEIALRIRESGRPKRDAAGQPVKNEKGETEKIPGTLKAVKAMGVLVERFNITQVSINLVDYEITPPHTAFEEVKKQAESLGCKVTGSEIVGLTPLDALLISGKFYAEKKGNVPPTGEKDLVPIAIESLGLSQLELFVPEKKIIDYMI